MEAHPVFAARIRDEPPVTRLQIRTAAVGVGGAIVAFLSICLLRIASIKPFVAGDENQHVDYALRLWHGVLPGHLADNTVAEMPGQAVQGQYVANHPPLYPYLVGWIFRLGMATGHPNVSVYLGRGVGALFAAAAIALMAATAFLIGGRFRAPLAIGTALVIAAVPTVIGVATSVLNDSLAMLFSAAMLYVLARMVRDGVTIGDIVRLVIVSSLGMLSRVQTIVPLVVCVGVLIVMALAPQCFPSAVDAKIRRPRAWIAAGASLVVPLLACGWFYLLNSRRYGDLIGSHMPGPVSPVLPHDSLLGISAHPGFWFYLLSQLFGRFPSSDPAAMHVTRKWPSAGGSTFYWPLIFAIAAIVVLLVGLLVVAVRRFPPARRTPDKGDSGPGIVDLRVPLIHLGLALTLVGAIAQTASHYSIGGSAHSRYLLGGLTIYAIAIAAASLAWRRLRLLPLALMVVGGLGGTWITWEGVLARQQIGLTGFLPHSVAVAMGRNGVPLSGLLTIVVGLLVLTGMGVALTAFQRSAPAETVQSAAVPHLSGGTG